MLIHEHGLTRKLTEEIKRFPEYDALRKILADAMGVPEDQAADRLLTLLAEIGSVAADNPEQLQQAIAGFTEAGEQGTAQGMKDGSALKIALHQAVGEALGGADGASAAGTNEMLMPLLVDLAGNSPERLRALSRIVGGASTGNAQGAWIAEQGTTWNRQLHQNEVIAIRDQAKEYAEKQGITESEALSALLLEGMRQVDEEYAGNILANPEAASFLQQIAQSDPDNALVSTDGKVTGFFEASDHDYGTFDAYKWQLWDVENGWYPGGVEDPNLLSQTFKDPQNILMLGKGEAYYSFDNLYQQVSGESASKANTQNLMILGSTAGSLGAIRLAGLARTETGLLLSNPTSYFYSQGYKLTLMADEAVAGLAGFPTGVVFGGGGAMLLDNMASGGGRYATALWDEASNLGAFGRGVDSNPGQFRFFEVDGGGAQAFDDIALEGQRRQEALLNTNQGFNISGAADEMSFPNGALGNPNPVDGPEGGFTFLTDRQAFEGVLGSFPDNHNTIRVTREQLNRLEDGMGLYPGSLESGSVIRQFGNVNDLAPASPLYGNEFFRGAGFHLPNAAPEIVVNPAQMRADNPNIINSWIVEVAE